MASALSTVRQQVGLPQGMVTGVPTGGFSTTGFQCSSLALETANYYLDWWLRFYSGTHKDTTRQVTVFVQANGTVTFSPAVTGDVDATDLFELHPPDWKPEKINSVINRAISMVEREALVDTVDETVVVNDLLTDGLFGSWSNSATLTYWSKTGTGTLARESSIKLEGLYSAKLTNTVGNAFGIYQSHANPALYGGQTASLYARMHAIVADRARIQLTDGVTTWNSDYHDGKGWRESEDDPWLEIEDVTLSDTPTQLTASARIETGAAIDVYVDKMRLVCGDDIYEYTLPSGFYTVESVIQESDDIDVFPLSETLNPEGYRLAPGPLLCIDNRFITLTAGRKLRIEGQAKPGQLTLDADTTTVNLAYLVQQAIALMRQGLVVRTGDNHHTQMGLAQAMADRERARLWVPRRGRRVP